MNNPFERISAAFAPEYRVNLSIANLDGSIMLTLSDDAGVVAKRLITPAQRNDPVRLQRVIDSIRLGLAIELSQNPARNAAIGMFADALGVEPTQQANWDVGRFSTFEPFPAGMQLRFRKGRNDGDVFLPDVIGNGLHEWPSW